MTQLHSPDSGGPDWTVIGGALAALATIATTIAAAAKGVFRSKVSAQADREKAATDNAALTLDSVFRLVNELQDEVKRKGEEISVSETRCAERIKACEDRIDKLLTRIGQLETQRSDGGQRDSHQLG